MYSSSNNYTQNSKISGYLNFGKNPFEKSRTFKILPTTKRLFNSVSGSHKCTSLDKNVDYLVNKAILKKRYLGILDPTSPNNKDIFIDSDSERYSTKRKTNNTKLVIEKSVSQYPKNIRDFGKYLRESSSSYNNILSSQKNYNIGNINFNRLYDNYDNINQRYYNYNIYNEPTINYNNEPSYTYNKPNIKLQKFNNPTYETNDSIMFTDLTPNKFSAEEKIIWPINNDNIYDSRRKQKINNNKIPGIPLDINDFDYKNYDTNDPCENYYKTNESNFYQTLKNQRKITTLNDYYLYRENNLKKNTMSTIQPYTKNKNYMKYRYNNYSKKKNYNYYNLMNQAACKIQSIWRGGQIREFMSFFYNINKLKFILIEIVQVHLRNHFKDFIEKLSQIQKPKYVKIQIPGQGKKKITGIYTNKTNLIINEKNKNIEKYKSLLSQKEKDFENLNKNFDDLNKKYEELLLSKSNNTNIENNEEKKSQILSMTTSVDNNLMGHKHNPSCFSILSEKKEFNDEKITKIQNDCFYILGNIIKDKEESKKDSEKEKKLRRNKRKEKNISNTFNYDEFAKYFISNLQIEKSNEIALINDKIEEINKFFDPCLLKKCLCNELDVNITPKKLIFNDNKLLELTQNNLNIEIIGNPKVKKEKSEKPVTNEDLQEEIEKKEESVKKDKKVKTKKKSQKELNLVLDSQLNNINIIQNGKSNEFDKKYLKKETSSFLNITPILPETETNKILSDNIITDNNNTPKDNPSKIYLKDDVMQFSLYNSEKPDSHIEIEKQKQENIISKISEICIINESKKNIDNKEVCNVILSTDSKKLNLDIVSKTSELFILNNNNVTGVDNKNTNININSNNIIINTKSDDKNETNEDNKNDIVGIDDKIKNDEDIKSDMNTNKIENTENNIDGTITGNKTDKNPEYNLELGNNKINNNLILESEKFELYIPSRNNNSQNPINNSKKFIENIVPNNTDSISLFYKKKKYDNQSIPIINKIISLKLNHKKILKNDKETEITEELYIIQPSNHYDLIFEGSLHNNTLTQNINTECKRFNDEENEEVNQEDMEINPLEFKRANNTNIIINHQNKLEVICDKNMQYAEKMKQNIIKIILPIKLKSNVRKCVSRFVIKSLKKGN